MDKNDLISREALKATIISICGKCSNIITKYENGVPDGNCAIQHILNIIDNAQTVEIKQGEWIEQKNYPYQRCKLQLGYECNQCGTENECKTNYCPNCGADMKGEWEVFYTRKQKKVFRCDKCLAISIQGKTYFCPNCGAKMISESEDK